MIKKNIILSTLFSAISCIYIGMQPHLSLNYQILASVNAVWLSIELFNYRNHPFSLHKMVNFFLYFFFVLANVIQCSEDSVVTSLKVHFTQEEYEYFQLLLLLIISSFNLIYHYLFAIFNRKRLYYWHTFKRPKECLLILLSAMSLACVLFYYKGNWMNMFFRGVVEQMAELNNGEAIEIKQSSSLLFDHFIRIIPAACYFLAAFYKVDWRIRLPLLLSFLISNFPLALSRNAVAMLWLPFLFLNFKIIKKPYFFVFIFIVGLLVIFPFLDNFRRFNGEVNFSISLDYLDSLNFDASQIFMADLQAGTITYGKQLLGALLFFVPRSIWPSKPVGSGAFLAEQQGVFSNISMPYFAEGYINFGFLGIFIFLVFIVLLCAYLDSRYWKYHCCDDTSLISIIYFLLVGAMVYIMRGDLMSSFAYTIGAVITIVFVYLLAIFPYKVKMFRNRSKTVYYNNLH